MKLVKIIFTIICFTVIALFYVNQQVEMVITSYKVRENKIKLNYLFDKNKYLQYNVNKLNSPSYLFSALNSNSKEEKFKLTRDIEVKRVNVTFVDSGASHKIATIKPKISLFSILLGIGAEADAKTVDKVRENR